MKKKVRLFNMVIILYYDLYDITLFKLKKKKLIQSNKFNFQALGDKKFNKLK